MKALISIGTRPEAIKMAPVIEALRSVPERFDVRICLTGQHREMLDRALSVFGLHGDRDLDVMAADQGLPELTGRLMEGMRRVLEEERPDVVLVQGDTTTVFTTALSAYYARVPVGHVEAGLRTPDLSQPFPEEANRRLTSVLTELHFAPTTSARDNLLREGVPAERIHVTGNTVIDALLQVAARIDGDEALRSRLERELPFGGARRLVLITAHRRESFGAPFLAVCEALQALAARHTDVDFVYPVHLNPNVQRPVRSRLGDIDNVHLLDPLDYVDFVHLMRRAHVILTDSGGIQEEAPAFGKPVLVMRSRTERPEAIDAGCARLVGTDRDVIEREVGRLLDDPAAHEEMARVENPFGDGSAAQKIRDALLAWEG